MLVADRIAFWIQLRASVQEVLNQHPGARLILAGDSNVYLSEIMGVGNGRRGEAQLRRLIRDMCRDFGLVFANPAGIPTVRVSCLASCLHGMILQFGV